MEVDPPADSSSAPIPASQAKGAKSLELYTSTIKNPPHAYAYLELVTDSDEAAELDPILVRSYCTAALKQFLGLTGMGMPIDILKVEGKECWLRIPREDLGAFAAAITAWTGATLEGHTSTLRILACGNWLGSLLGHATQRKLWGSP
ncbi:hypothetical protein NKR23_g7054 [Pleurostoma richardsiae]|uniref:Ribonucleases P/MRP subunit Pop8-like domain-containing protein n=1 Tax=Pleurostoma richardsiae TaxID=41990 RepID=A0AA38RNX3_9PEZI|nr:hypothetical protein NKR23_g7054 [Pleurostoma richardsiae]